MTDLGLTIAAKSDQLNADDLIDRPITIRITKVSLAEGDDQPITIHFEGDGGKPYKPCKSMRRVLVHCWKRNGNAYVGRSMRLYRDDKVKFGGLEVGGTRISHLSDIPGEMSVAILVTKGKKAAYKVLPLRDDAARRPSTPPSQAPPPADEDEFPGDRPSAASTERDAPPAAGFGSAPTLTLAQRTEAFLKRVQEAPNVTKLQSVGKNANALRADLERADPERLVEVEAIYDARMAELERNPAAD